MELDSDSTKRSHHNALERKRRDHIKESFNGLRDSVPSLNGEKASRAQILNKATEYINSMTKKNQLFKSDIDELSKQNQDLEIKIQKLEDAKKRGIFQTATTTATPATTTSQQQVNGQTQKETTTTTAAAVNNNNHQQQ